MSQNSCVGKKRVGPLHIRAVKRGAICSAQKALFRCGAFAAALLTGALLIMLLGYNPISVYADMLYGALGTRVFAIETIRTAVQLLLVGISVAFSFKIKFFNIGADGQLLAGALAASYFALFHVNNMPQIVLILTMMLAAIIAGGILGVIPAIFKAKWSTNEVLFTLMLNYVMINFAKFLQNGPWKAPGSAFPKVAMFAEGARLTNVLGVNWGWIFVLFLAAGAWIYFNKTKHGYEITVVGESSATAQYAGINVKKVLIRTIFISGAIAGIAGFFQVAGIDYSVGDTSGGGVGYTAITVGWLANLHPIGMMLTSLLISVLERGSSSIQTTFKIPQSAADVLTGIILVFMLGCEFFMNYKLIAGSKKEDDNG
ncbi:MAG: ABC transporter permease [Bacillota bacterium]